MLVKKKTIVLTKTLHRLSKDLSFINTRLQIIYNDVQEQLNDKDFVCSSHFTRDCSVHFCQHVGGLKISFTERNDSNTILVCL